MTVAIIDYGIGSLRAVAKALERVCAETGLDERIIVTSSAAEVAAAARIVLHGHGAFGDCRRGLDAVPGMVEALQEAVIRRAQPFLGICVGMQLMATVGREHGDHPGLGWIPGEVVPLTPAYSAREVPHPKWGYLPHMGWNPLEIAVPGHPVLAGLERDTHVYFAHSYGFRARDQADVLASANHGGSFAAVVGRDNLVGTQFHPEKSQAAGLRLLENFLRWRP